PCSAGVNTAPVAAVRWRVLAARVPGGVDMVKRLESLLMAAVLAVGIGPGAAWAQTRWPEAKANAWYATQPWLVGNYIPRSAINQLEMWQEATFDPVQIDKELA